jgi:glyoxylase-like metal-dependent hydrolase (beta-lactamase superfamily II)
MKLTNRVYLVGGSGYGLSPIGDCNVYLLDGGSEMALIDTGGGYGVTSFLKNIKNDGLKPQRITNTLITHCHFDHIGGNFDIKKKTGTKVFCHPADKEAIEKLNEHSLYYMGQERGLEFKATNIDVTIEEGNTIQVGDIILKVIHNPGHTPGCISFLFNEDGVQSLFCGDITSALGKLGYINGPGFELDDWKHSIKKLVKIAPQRLFPGHGTFLLSDALLHLKLYDQKMNSAWVNIVTEVG